MISVLAALLNKENPEIERHALKSLCGGARHRSLSMGITASGGAQTQVLRTFVHLTPSLAFLFRTSRE